MIKWGDLLTRHRNVFLLLLLLTTLIVSGYANQEQLESASVTVSIPVTEASAASLSPLEAYRRQRDQETLSDITALEQLIAQPALDESTRQAAAERLQALIDKRQSQISLEGALTGSSLSPCVAVAEGGSLTIVTEKKTITQQDTALVLTLTAAHVGVSPENVRIITAE